MPETGQKIQKKYIFNSEIWMFVQKNTYITDDPYPFPNGTPSQKRLLSL